MPEKIISFAKRLLTTVKQKLSLVPIPVSIILLLILASLIYILRDLPSPTDLTNKPVPLTTKILDRNGKLLYNIFIAENRTVVSLDQVPKTMQQATISIEDKDFYKHNGIDFIGGIVRAIKDMVLYHRLEGGSTLTQQLIKTSLLTPERTITRKFKELILAFWTERLYGKDKILALYLNRIPYGGTAYGVEEAAQIFFGKHASQLDLAQSALLAGLPQAPTYYSPFGTDPGRSIARQHEVLDRMLEDGYISKDQQLAAQNEPLVFASQSAGIKAPHFVAYVREILAKKYGEQQIEQGGLQVTTSLDLDLQTAAEASLSSEVDKQKDLKVGNGAALVTNPSTGEILAMVGSKDYFASGSGKVNVVLAQRSPGSSIKPLNYAVGFLTGKATPATPWIDSKFCFPPFAGKSYCPGNYDGHFHGVQQTRFALGSSFNIPATKMLAVNGMDDFLATASAMGLTTLTDKNRYGYSLTLGGGEVKMIDMAVAFGVFANAGRKQDLLPILKVEDSSGKVLESYQQPGPQPSIQQPTPWDGSTLWQPHDNFVLPEEVTYLISHILLDDSARAQTFGAGSILNVRGLPVSVKTGTTEDKRDNWTIGYTSGKDSRLVAVWVGNNDNSPMSPYLESGNTGAAPIWHDIMTYTLRDITPQWPQKPDNVVFIQICSLSGLLPDHDCPQRGEYFIKAFTPKDKDNVWGQKKKIQVFKDSHKQPLAGDKPNPDQLTDEDHIVISDPLQKDFCVDCPL